MDNMKVRMAVAVIVGIVVGGLIVFLVEGVGHMLYPPPPGIDLQDPAGMAVIVERMPVAAKLMVLLGWLLGSLGGALIANRIACSTRAGWIVAAVSIALTAYTFVVIPHPMWMMVGGVGLPLLSAWIAARLSGGSRTR